MAKKQEQAATSGAGEAGAASGTGKRTQSRADKRCRVPKCKRPYRAKGYCNVHYREWRHGGRPRPRFKPCHAEGCRKPMVRSGWGLCQEHFDGARKAKAAEAA